MVHAVPRLDPTGPLGVESVGTPVGGRCRAHHASPYRAHRHSGVPRAPERCRTGLWYAYPHSARAAATDGETTVPTW